MLKRIVAATLATAFLAVTSVPMASAEDKKLTPQQQKMKDCNAGWKDEKTKTGAKGKDAYRKFMSECLKKT